MASKIDYGAAEGVAKRMYEAGHPLSEITRETGLGKNQIAGLANRRRWDRALRPENPWKVAARHGGGPRQGSGRPKAKKDPKPEIIKAPPPPPPQKAITSDVCLFPMWGDDRNDPMRGTYCGAKVTQGDMCEEHRARCKITPPAAKPRELPDRYSATTGWSRRKFA